LLGAEQPGLPALLLAAEVTGASRGRERQRDLAARAVQLGDDTGWGQYWLGDSYAELNDEARTAYRTAIEQMNLQLEAGATPRHTATLWQAIHLAATRLEDAELAAQAARKASQEAAICAALGAEIHSVMHRQAVPPELFLESLPPHHTGDTVPTATAPAISDKATMKPIVGPTESRILRSRRLREGGV